MVALHSGRGQVVDVSLLESIFHMLGPLISVWLTRGELQERMGSGIPYTVPRGAYRCSDGKFIGLSTSSDSVAQRVMALLGFSDDASVATFEGRVASRERIEAAMREWCAARTQEQALRELSEADAAAGPIMDMADIAADPHYAARDAIITVEGTPMQGLVAKLSGTPGAVRWRGRARDADGEHIRRNGWD
jgi:crotonobetainyl-CoA:carnitine CoA-transferase CaiB-like acyl-CoA transferase